MLLLSGYLGSCGAVQYLAPRGVINRNLHNALNSSLYAPVVWFCQSELPGGSAAKAVIAWLYQRGAGSNAPLETIVRPVFVSPSAGGPIVAPHAVTPPNPES